MQQVGNELSYPIKFVNWLLSNIVRPAGIFLIHNGIAQYAWVVHIAGTIIIMDTYGYVIQLYIISELNYVSGHSLLIIPIDGAWHRFHHASRPFRCLEINLFINSMGDVEKHTHNKPALLMLDYFYYSTVHTTGRDYNKSVIKW